MEEGREALLTPWDWLQVVQGRGPADTQQQVPNPE